MKRSHRRWPLSKAELLPLPTSEVRQSPEDHLALGQGEAEQLGRLLRLIYLTFLLRDLIPGAGNFASFQAAEVTLDRCLNLAEHDEEWALHDVDFSLVERTVVLHDRQLAAVPVHRLLTACDRLTRYLFGDTARTLIQQPA
ncbi:hypothetical protein WL93_13000 [Burkholderia diffusa]|uniref:hypothetical protein n=1 Tax=Burkholderia diffusa TaxID=488732 RepID=UPI0007537D76|nr:hypothetical protein [Burkholderia diffusa]KWF91966.1 hypothetical protein WL93_13000 [Burkholderia diffusa]